MSSRAEHWNRVHSARKPTEVSWYQVEPKVALELVDAAGVPKDAPVLDVGAGASTLADALLDRGYRDVTLLDVSEAALGHVRERLGARMAEVRTVVSDVTAWQPERRYALGHDRAVFHFLTEAEDRASYLRALDAALAPDGVVVLATFADDGPVTCSGLPVRRYSVDVLAAEVSGVLRLVESRREAHTTPGGAVQSFVYGSFRRR